MNIFLVEFGTPLYSKTIELRDEVLRKPLNLSFTEEQLAEEWEQFHLVALDDKEELKGVLVLKPVSKSRLKMRQVAVSPESQGKGIGKQLVIASEKIALDKGFKVMELSAREVSLPFYDKLKYDRVGDRYEEVGIPHFKMEKKLK